MKGHCSWGEPCAPHYVVLYAVKIKNMHTKLKPIHPGIALMKMTDKQEEKLENGCTVVSRKYAP